MKTQRRIAIILQNGLFAYQRELVRGISDFARVHGGWSIGALIDHKPSSIPALNVDGMIVFRDVPTRRRSRTPRVHVGTQEPPHPPGTIQSDNVRIGELAAEHLLERGLRHFAFAAVRIQGHPQGPMTRQREQGFRECVERAGANFYGHCTFPNRRSNSKVPSMRKQIRWLNDLPKPVGIMCMDDGVARQVADACHAAGYSIPDQVAVIGANNDELMGMLSNPPITSVDPGAKELGYHAAAMLEQILLGETPPREPVIVPPVGVVVRQSSDLLAIDDPDVAAAVRFIRENYTAPINAQDVLDAVPMARQVLERRFRKHVGRSIHQEIKRLRIHRACDLLIHSNLPVPEIASGCGFSGRDYFTTAFTQATGVSPAAYRRQGLRAAEQRYQ